MPVIQLECYVVACDSCGDTMENGDGLVPHYETEQDALGMVGEVGDDWTGWEDHVWCWRDDCVPSCACGGTFKEHDYGDGPCENGECVEKCQDFRLLEEGSQ